MSNGFIPKSLRWVIVALLVVFMIEDYAVGRWIFGTVELLLGIFLCVMYSIDNE